MSWLHRVCSREFLCKVFCNFSERSWLMQVSSRYHVWFASQWSQKPQKHTHTLKACASFSRPTISFFHPPLCSGWHYQIKNSEDFIGTTSKPPNTQSVREAGWRTVHFDGLFETFNRAGRQFVRVSVSRSTTYTLSMQLAYRQVWYGSATREVNPGEQQEQKTRHEVCCV